MESCSLYVHIPWCVQKCPYCDFNSHEIKGQINDQPYLQALLDDLQQDLSNKQPRPVSSVFFGGGTPSSLSGDFYRQFLTRLSGICELGKDIEITMEANPGTVDVENFAAYREAGINRLSLGIQSFNDGHLQKLGRVHNAYQAKQAIEIARLAGFENVNLDLMFALPGQSVEQALADLETAVSFNPTHLSWYQLTLEPNTAFAFDPPADLPDDDLTWQIQQQGQKLLQEAGYEQYEISAYATSGFQCRHNLNYWMFGDYLGIGAGAHGKWTHESSGEVIRNRKKRHPEAYLKGPFLAGEDRLSQEDLVFEYMLNVLRLRQGFELQEFSQNTGMKKETVLPKLEEAMAKQLIIKYKNRYFPSEKGWSYLNDLQQLFLP